MGHYNTYCGRIKLAKNTNPTVLQALHNLITMGLNYHPPIEEDDVFFLHPYSTSVFSDYRRSTVPELTPCAELKDQNVEGYELRFCANSKAQLDVYHFLLAYLHPWIVNKEGDLLIAGFAEDYHSTEEHDKTQVDCYAWTTLHQGHPVMNRVDNEAPWVLCAEWFAPFKETVCTLS